MRHALALASLVLPLAAAACGGAATGPPIPAERGDATRGKVVFADADCGNCHVLADAGTSGRTGPSLDERSATFEEALDQVAGGGGGMPAYRDRLTVREIQDVATYVADVMER
ncbi:MAG: c-type cytochrome [Thermoleophilia bacterium]